MKEELAAGITLYPGDNREVLRELTDDSIDSIVTDPPYALNFMGKAWDTGAVVNDLQFWAECLRVLKPGGHLVAFSGTRTYHRMACAIEDAGFEIRDMVQWLYGSGFPKSHDVSKGIDRGVRGNFVLQKIIHFRQERGWTRLKLGKMCGFADAEKTVWDWEEGGHVPSDANWQKARSVLGVTDAEEAKFERIITRQATAEARSGDAIAFDQRSSTERERRDVPATDLAREWAGWGTALKPANEPICLARKPLSEKTVAANVLRWSVGALNINATRVHPDTTDILLSRARQSFLRAEIEFGNSMFGKDPSLDADGFASRLGKQLTGASLTSLAGEHGSSNEGIYSSPQDSKDHCQVCRHFCDALALMAQERVQARALLSRYVRKHSHRPKLADDPVGARLDSLRCECMIRLSNLDCALCADRGIDSHFEQLRHSVAEYLELCLRCTEIPLQGPSNGDLAHKVAQWLVPESEKTSLERNRRGEDWPIEQLLFNILFGPYLITNTAAILIDKLQSKSRWPANVITDGSEEVREGFPDSESGGNVVSPPSPKTAGIYGDYNRDKQRFHGHADSGSAARFFYCAKANKKDRAGSKHPTVKPVKLMQWLVRLVTPPGGTVLDPFAGTGTTGQAALLEGMSCILIERETEYQADIRARHGHATLKQPDMFVERPKAVQLELG